MALVPGYEFDIFISYAHVDNTPLPGEKERWVEFFYKTLDIMLAKRFGRADMVKIWWDDRKLDGSTVFDGSIANGVDRSALIICLDSPGYAASTYCQQELDRFHGKAKAEPFGLQIGDRSRIVHVLLNNIPHDRWPSELQGTTGFPFHNSERRDDPGDALDPGSIAFNEQMRDLRDAV
ncbi:MAG TPA: toll/interleukin-1 receptor domain-containing protein, partial [Flavobacteriales bacterium]|nr:toll/interleukin-1 receptor domain-containing protein [Flavobacteriales bacterium]